MKFDNAYFRDIKKNLVKRVKERQKAERMLHPPVPTKKPRKVKQVIGFKINWMAYHISGSGSASQLLYTLPNGREVYYSKPMGRKECHDTAFMLSRELRNSPNLMAELIPHTPGDTPDSA